MRLVDLELHWRDLGGSFFSSEALVSVLQSFLVSWSDSPEEAP